jgi:hypothetical protein
VLALVALTGIPFAGLLVWFIVKYIPKTVTSPTTGAPEHSCLVKTISGGFIGTLTGLIGVAILRRFTVDLQGLGILYASSACGLGGLALGGVTLHSFSLLSAAFIFVFSPLFFSMRRGLEFAFQRAVERRGADGSYRYASISVLGSWNEGSEIHQEISKRDRKRL